MLYKRYITMIFSMLVLESCSAGLSDAIVTDTSPAALANFFTEECIGQRGADRARSDYRIEKENCQLNDDQCLGSLPAKISWTIPIDATEKVDVSYEWRVADSKGPPDGQLACSIAVSNKLSGNLRAAISYLRVGGRGFHRVNSQYAVALIERVEAWESESRTGLVLTLQHYYSPNQKDPGPIPAKDSFDYSSYTKGLDDANNELITHAERPWKLKIGLSKYQP